MKPFVILVLFTSLVCAITFPVDTVTTHNIASEELNVDSLLSQNIPLDIITRDPDAPDLLSRTDYHGFLNSLEWAYVNHQNLTLSPDMIWLLLIQGTAIHINCNSEELRGLFVKHEGRKNIKIDQPQAGSAREMNWQELTAQFSDSIKTYVVPKSYTILHQSFSTTTNSIRTIYDISMMDAMQSYFSYECGAGCGFPKITLEGSSEDWKQLIQNAKALRRFKLEWWIDPLIPLLEEFESASRGVVDRTFWQGLFKYTTIDDGYEMIPNINGEIIRFFPYLKTWEKSPYCFNEKNFMKNPYLEQLPTQEEGVSPNVFPGSMSNVPVIISYPNGKKETIVLCAGFYGFTQDHRSYTVRPTMLWYVMQ